MRYRQQLQRVRSNPKGSAAPQRDLLIALYLLEVTQENSELFPLGSTDYNNARAAGVLFGYKLKKTKESRRGVDSVLRVVKSTSTDPAYYANRISSSGVQAVANWASTNPMFRAFRKLDKKKMGALHEKVLEAWVESNESPLATKLQQAVDTGSPHNLRRLASEVYRTTQEETPWKSKVLYRGVRGNQAEEIRHGKKTLQTRSLSSWTSDPNVPARYAAGGVRVAVTVPKKKVFLQPGDLRRPRRRPRIRLARETVQDQINIKNTKRPPGF